MLIALPEGVTWVGSTADPGLSDVAIVSSAYEDAGAQFASAIVYANTVTFGEDGPLIQIELAIDVDAAPGLKTITITQSVLSDFRGRELFLHATTKGFVTVVSSAEPVLALGSVSAPPSGMAVVPLTLTGGDQEFTALHLVLDIPDELSFDAAAVEAAMPGFTVVSNAYMDGTNQLAGIIAFSGTNTYGADGVLMRLEFAVDPFAVLGPKTVSVRQSGVIDISGLVMIAHSTSDGLVTVGEGQLEGEGEGGVEGLGEGEGIGEGPGAALRYDGIDDFLLIAQFGNPRNRGPVGEGYLIYGQDGIRFGGDINVNSVSTSISGTIFEGSPIGLADLGPFIGIDNPRSDGITSASWIPDLDGDGRPELLFGMGHTDGVRQGRDDDPGDDPPDAGASDNVTLSLRQGQSVLTVGDGDPTFAGYDGMEDTYIDSANPNASFGSSTELQWVDNGPGDRRWVLIKFTDLLDEIPDTAGNITGLSATVQVRVVDEGDDANVFEMFTDFSESSANFNNFAQNGGEPQEDVDYADEDLGNLSGDTAGEFTDVDVTPLIQKLIDGQLDDIDNEIRLIVVPDDDDGNQTTSRSSEFGDVADQRPTLTITYNRTLNTGSVGCYPDFFVNNLATTFPEDDTTEALGYVVVVSSLNRDNHGVPNPDRLESTAVEIDLVGQEGEVGGFLKLAQGPNPGRIAGGRFQVGWYDLVDHALLNQPPLNARCGWTVSSIPDMDNDQLPEILISAPTNEFDIAQTLADFPGGSTHVASRGFFGSIIVLPGEDFELPFWRDKDDPDTGNSILPSPRCPGAPPLSPICINPKQSGCCSGCLFPRRDGPTTPTLAFEIFAETVDDFLGGAQSAGDFNLDGVPDILAGAPGNDPGGITDAGAVYIFFGRTPTGDFDLRDGAADNALTRPPMLRIFGETENDQLGGELIRGDVRVVRKAGFIRQISGLDINGDRIDDVIFGAPRADFGDVSAPNCSPDFDGNGVIDDNDLSLATFDSCQAEFGSEVFLSDDCKVYDFDNDRELTTDNTRGYSEDNLVLNDRDVLECLIAGDADCCPIDNGFVGIIFGGTTTDGDRTLSQLATADLPGTIFYGADAGHRIGMDIASAGDFNKDGNGDLLIVAPGVTVLDENLQTRVGVVYLIFGGQHLNNRSFVLSPAEVGTDDLPGIVFMSPYVDGRPNEAPPDHVGLLGDINNDGFDDIAIGITRADSVDESLPQAPGGAIDEPTAGRRPDAGDVYIIYGNNVGSNTLP
ncbi:MAG: FG-GAP repeat protein [Planctomycetes bacterium]|nr:FG-GAP repeat protein [Planctomycetota bacterium]